MQNIKTSLLPDSIENILLKEHIITESQLNWAKFKQTQTGERLENILLKEGIIDEKSLALAYSIQYKIEFIDEDLKIDYDIIKYIPKEILHEYEFIPIKKEDNILKIAIHNPYQYDLFEDIERRTRLKVQPFIIEKSKLLKKRKELLSNRINISELKGSGQFLDSILIYAWDNNASDIHFIFESNHLQIKYRISGDLIDGEKIPLQDADFLLVRLKILANLDITEHFLPQEGHFIKKISNKSVNFRVSILPSYFGENVVIRLLNKKDFNFSINNIGFLPEQIEILERILMLKKGLILVGGPTGSGKSTTLYTFLNFLKIKFPEKKIMTIEDPIEFPLPGISQTQVTHSDDTTTRLTFTKGLRAILRQDPDIIMIGEIREKESAIIAVNAAITGHLVLASIHASNVLEIINRMRYFSVPDHLFLESTNLLISQIIYKKLCPDCKHPTTKFGINGFISKGCSRCQKKGSIGITGAFELLLLNKDIRKLLLNNKLLSVIEDEAKKYGLITLKEILNQKLKDGEISINEYYQLVGG